MLRFRSTLLVLVGVCVNCLDAFGESRSYEDRLTFRVYSPSVQQHGNHEALLELRTQINKVHDAEFLKELALSNINLGEQGSGLFADNNNVSYTCREHWNRTIAGLLRSEFWAFKMLDASGKIGAGILEGNTKWLGSYDECFRIDRTLPGMPPSNSGFSTQFCGMKTNVPLGVIPLEIELTACVPKACSPKDLTYLYNDLLKRLPTQSPVRVHDVKCNVDPEIDTRAVVAIVILGIFAALMFVSTVYDLLVIQRQRHAAEHSQSEILSDHIENLGENSPLLNSREKKSVPKQESVAERLLLAFSVYSNGKKILQVNQSSGTLTALNGIRFLSISWVVLDHTFGVMYPVLSNGYAILPDLYQRWSFQAVANAFVAVDSFFALSGLLLAYLTLKEMKKGQGKFRINWFMFYFHRFWRLTPAYMLLMMISICLSRYFGEGPLWPDQGIEVNYCKNTWWKNLLYINNFYSEQSCFGVSWYLANDMQFFVLSPLMLAPLYFKYRVGMVICFIWLLGSAITPGVISNVLNLPPSAFGGGGTIQGRTDYLSNYYARPYCRIGPYIVGIIVGSLMYKTDCKVKINKYLNLLLWLVFATLAMVVLYGLRDPINFPEDALNRDVSALYNATHRIVWGACVCWVIFACATGNGGFINTLLSWSPFVPLARLSYCIFLSHFMIISTYFDSQKSLLYMDDLNAIYVFLATLVLSVMVAFVASLSFEAPMMGLEKVIFKRDRRN
ncbi:nose resistant to fluoxetine protein 6-like [Crassostrea angulata]|uniref:nose resistant to fluoxetine protein 6-like n=1 Tax=Magallana angulata TaxID=2784310 RepID=UPI0022B0D353|nr:nose resistant to fluoxetine protein 6-like [Crassostrea angulata]